MHDALVLIARAIAFAHDRWRAETARRLTLSGHIAILEERGDGYPPWSPAGGWTPLRRGRHRPEPSPWRDGARGGEFAADPPASAKEWRLAAGGGGGPTRTRTWDQGIISPLL